jgi:hypothetical protein
MNRSFAPVVLALGLVACLLNSQSAQARGLNNIPVQGDVLVEDEVVGEFVGKMTIHSLERNLEATSLEDVLLASGEIKGKLNGKHIKRKFSGVPVLLSHGEEEAAEELALLSHNGDCEILDLDLGPIHLDLLGLVIDLDEVHLDIVAEAGPGNLLGNLLCAVVGLLDGLGGLADLLEFLDLFDLLLDIITDLL